MSAFRPVTAFLLASCLGACRDRPVPPTGAIDGFPEAIAQLECGPADGPATTLYLTREAADTAWTALPRVQATVYDSPERVTGRVLTLDGRETGSALWCRGERDCVPAERATLEFESPLPADTARGWVDLRFPGLPPVRGRFAAEWRETQMLCG